MNKFEIVLSDEEVRSFLLSPVAMHTDCFKIANQLRKQLPCEAKVGDAVWITKGEIRQTGQVQVLVENAPTCWLTSNYEEVGWGRWWDKTQFSIERA